MLQKRCSNCFELKPVDQFYRKLDRHQSRCKQCNNEVCFAWRNRHRPKKLERYFETRGK